jgi:hypothetical protein
MLTVPDSRIILRAAIVAVLVFLTLPAHAQELSRRIILKDGSYQLVNKYEVKGDRIRYYSTERDEWEELPNSLVDWPATEKYEKDRAAGASVPEAVQLDKEIDQEHEVEDSKLPQVAPGLRLPEESGVFLLDTFQGEAQIDELNQTAGDISRGSKANIFRGAMGGLKQTVELDGAHATVQSHVGVPTIYIKEDTSAGAGQDPAPGTKPGQPEQPQQPVQPIVPFDRFRIIHTEIKNDKRILGDIKRQPTGKTTQEQHAVKTTITNVAGGWLKITPIETLAPGEYALIEMMGKEGMNAYVWDFGVNPKAPTNANPWKPDAKTTSPPLPAKAPDK